MSRRRTARSILPIVIIAAGVILILGAGLFFLNPFGSLVDATPTAPAAGIPLPEIARVSLADAKAAYDTGAAVIVDVRGDPFYSQGHIPGALSIPLVELPDRLDELDPAGWILTYCT